MILGANGASMVTNLAETHRMPGGSRARDDQSGGQPPPVCQRGGSGPPRFDSGGAGIGLAPSSAQVDRGKARRSSP